MIDYTALSHGQIESKVWLCEELEKRLPDHARIALLGGWYGMTAFLLLSRRQTNIQYIKSYDIDPKVESIADKINNAYVFDDWKFKAFTKDVNQVDLSEFNVVINTSSEHILDKTWFTNLQDQLIVIQGTDQIHDDNEEHDYVFSLEQFELKYPMNILYKGQKTFTYPDKSFNRYMLIGFKLSS